MDQSSSGSSLGNRLKAPEDGIVASGRAKSWLGERWIQVFKTLRSSHHTQLARGRTLARAGRVRDLWFAPGIAHAEVVTSREVFRVSIRVRVFEDNEWTRLIKLLKNNLFTIACMLEGRLPQIIVERLESRSIQLIPKFEEVDGSCECSDFRMPCAHMAAVHNVLADALDGDPFLLLTLRGRDREQILTQLRRSWGDRTPLAVTGELSEEIPEEDDWETSPEPLTPLMVSVAPAESNIIGLRSLGPPPGQVHLVPTLSPLYNAGASAAYELAMAEPPSGYREIPPYGWVREWTGETPRPVRPRHLHPNAADSDSAVADFTGRLVDLLSELGSAKSKDIAVRLKIPMMEVRQELLELEKLGIVYRTGQTRGTLWWLG
jgi:uncharacterized Zn finger protein